MKYKIGDQVWILNLREGGSYGDFSYSIGNSEKDISLQLVTLTGWYNDDNDAYDCDQYRGISEEMIDHEKTATIGKDISYEIY